jgi:signal transduction histidine kinase
MVNETNLILVVLAGSLFMFLLVLVVVIFVVTYIKRARLKESNYLLELKNKDLESLREVIKAQEEERSRLAESLHDEIGPLLTVLKLNVSKHMRALERGYLMKEDLDAEREFIDDIISNTRSISHQLKPHFIVNNGLTHGLKHFGESISSFYLSVHSKLENEDCLGNQVVSNCYLILLEILNNLMKHDQPIKVDIYLDFVSNGLQLVIKHDGIGMTMQEFNERVEAKKGLGLSSIQSRLLVLDGSIQFSREEKKHVTHILIPLAHDNQN